MLKWYQKKNGYSGKWNTGLFFNKIWDFRASGYFLFETQKGRSHYFSQYSV